MSGFKSIDHTHIKPALHKTKAGSVSSRFSYQHKSFHVSGGVLKHPVQPTPILNTVWIVLLLTPKTVAVCLTVAVVSSI
jgi:hypothetical protein